MPPRIYLAYTPTYTLPTSVLSLPHHTPLTSVQSPPYTPPTSVLSLVLHPPFSSFLSPANLSHTTATTNSVIGASRRTDGARVSSARQCASDQTRPVQDQTGDQTGRGFGSRVLLAWTRARAWVWARGLCARAIRCEARRGDGPLPSVPKI